MTTKMLINGTRDEQLRVAIVDGTILQEYQVEIAEDGLTRGNIYRGVVANIQPSLNAAFIDIGEERHGFLPVADVLPSAYHKKPPSDARRPRIDQVLEKGKPILVQVTKDGVGQKGPALNTNLAIAGRYLVHTPYDSVRGISRKVGDDDARKKVRDRLKKLSLPDTHGVIVRTNGLDQNQTTLNRDLAALLRLWKKINAESEKGKGPKLIYSDQDLVVQALRDYLDPNISEIVVDSDEVFQRAQSYMKAFMPRTKIQLVRYEDRLPLFSRFRLETQIDRIYERSAPLPSGGMIVIDQTEALTAIDVNSARATRNDNHDESIFKINCEAAVEVARQLRLRDIGGLVVIDFIDMRLRKHQNKLEKVMRDSMKPDKARWSVAHISPNGLLEINRQRIKQALRLRTHRPCPTCSGLGSTPTPEFAALRLLSRIEARAATGLMHSVSLALHPEIADSLQNHYRKLLAAIEDDHGIHIEIMSASSLGRTEERVDWVQKDGATPDGNGKTVAAVGAADLTVPERRRRRGERNGKSDDKDSKSSKDTREAGKESRDRKESRRSAKDDRNERNDRNDRNDRNERNERPERGRRRGRSAEAEGEGNERPTRTRRRSRRRGAEDSQEADVKESTAQSQEVEAAARDDAKHGEGTTRRRRRRRSRRGTGQDRNDREASRENTDDQPQETTRSARSDGDDGPGRRDGQEEADSSTRRRSRRRRSRRGERAADEAQPPARSESRRESRGASYDDEDDSPKRNRRRRSRRRGGGSGSSGSGGGGGKVSRGNEAPRQSKKKPVDDSIGNRISKSEMRKKQREVDGNRQPGPKKQRRGRGKGGHTNYDERQPDSNESALHRKSIPTKVDPLPPPVDLSAGAPDRPVSQRLRWQWWGGGSDGGSRTGRPLPPDED